MRVNWLRVIIFERRGEKGWRESLSLVSVREAEDQHHSVTVSCSSHFYLLLSW